MLAPLYGHREISIELYCKINFFLLKNFKLKKALKVVLFPIL